MGLPVKMTAEPEFSLVTEVESWLLGVVGKSLTMPLVSLATSAPPLDLKALNSSMTSQACSWKVELHLEYHALERQDVSLSMRHSQ